MMVQEIVAHIIGNAWTVVITLLSIVVYCYCLTHDKK